MPWKVPEKKALERGTPLANRRYELFCQEFVGGETMERAYKLAFEKSGISARSNASRLMMRPEIKARVRELQEQAAEQSSAKLADVQSRMLARSDR
jgi:phage terminase small subunit